MAVYSNAVPGAASPDPITGRDIRLTVSPEGHLRYLITESRTENFQPVGPGVSCEATGRLVRREERWVVVEETSTCGRPWPLPHEHAVTLGIFSRCILKIRAQPALSGGIEDMAFTQPQCLAELRGKAKPAAQPTASTR